MSTKKIEPNLFIRWMDFLADTFYQLDDTGNSTIIQRVKHSIGFILYMSIGIPTTIILLGLFISGFVMVVLIEAVLILPLGAYWIITGNFHSGWLGDYWVNLFF